MMIMFLVVILPPRGLDPSSLRVALNLLSSSFPLSLFCCVQKIFLAAVTRPGSLIGFVLFLSFEVIF